MGRRTNSSDEGNCRAPRRCGRRKPSRNDDDNASTTSASTSGQSLQSQSLHGQSLHGDSERSVSELKNFLIKENSRKACSSVESKKFLIEEDSRTSRTTDTDTMGSCIPEENQPPKLTRLGSDEFLDRRCSRR